MDEPVVSLESFYALKTGHNPGPPGGGKFLGFVGDQPTSAWFQPATSTFPRVFLRQQIRSSISEYGDQYSYPLEPFRSS